MEAQQTMTRREFEDDKPTAKQDNYNTNIMPLVMNLRDVCEKAGMNVIIAIEIDRVNIAAEADEKDDQKSDQATLMGGAVYAENPGPALLAAINCVRGGNPLEVFSLLASIQGRDDRSKDN